MSQLINEIETRQPVWKALSELYLDTELSTADFERIALVLKQSGYTLAQLKEIDLLEVFPLLQVNLMSPAGVWDGFDTHWLFLNCEKNYKKKQRWFHQQKYKFLNKFSYAMREDYWNAIESKIQALL